jgi:hypothetical protein
VPDARMTLIMPTRKKGQTAEVQGGAPCLTRMPSPDGAAWVCFRVSDTGFSPSLGTTQAEGLGEDDMNITRESLYLNTSKTSIMDTRTRLGVGGHMSHHLFEANNK